MTTTLDKSAPVPPNGRNNVFAAIAQELSAFETVLRDEIGAEDSPPHFGLLPSAAKAEALVARYLSLRATKVEAVPRVLHAWPAVGVAALSSLVRRTLGTVSGNEFYQHLDTWIGEPTKEGDRAEIHAAFRAACRSLGLPLVTEPKGSRTSRINDYVLQAGVTDHMMPAMLDAFWRTRSVEGLPDPDDAAECTRWSRLAFGRLLNQTRLRMVLESDATGHYAAVFAQACAGSAVRGFAARLRSGLAGAEAVALRNAFDTTEPLLRFEEGDLRVLLPEVAGCRWTLALGHEPAAVDAADRTTHGFADTVPTMAAWTLSARDGRRRRGEIPVLADGTGEPELLLFDEENGALVARTTASERRIAVAKGAYRAVSRDPLRVGADQGYALRAGVQVIDIDVERERVSVICGGRTFVLEPTDEPRLRFRGSRLLDVDGRPLHTQDGLVLDVDLPSDAEGQWEIALAPGAKRVSLPPSATGRVHVDLGPHLDRKPEIVRVRAGLVPAGGARPIATARTLAILGATGVHHGRVRGVTPANVDPDHCRHMSFAQDGWGVSLSEALVEGTLVVAPDRAGTIAEPLELRLPRPGTRIRRVWQDESGARAEQALRLGADLAVSAHMPGFVEIECDDPWSEILVGGESRGKPFLRRSSIRISIASLYDLARRAEAEIVWIGADDERETVLRAVLPAEPRDLTVNAAEDGAVIVRFALAGAVSAIRVRSIDLYADAVTTTDLDVGACCEPGSGEAARFAVALPPLGWNGAACVCSIEVRFDDEQRWRRLSSPRHGDVLIGHEGAPELVPPRFPDGLLARVLQVVDTPVMDVCAPHLRWLGEVVDAAMLAAWRRSRPDDMALLVDHIFPQRSHSARRLAGPGRLFCALPHTLAEDLTCLRHAEIAPDPTIDVLRIAADACEANDVPTFALDFGRLDDVFLTSFEGWAGSTPNDLIAAGLGSFRLSEYATALAAVPQAVADFDPRRDSLLGPRHLAWAAARAAEALEQAPPEAGRLGLATAMAADLACNPRRAEHALLCDCVPNRLPRLPLFPAGALEDLPLLNGADAVPRPDPRMPWTAWRLHGLRVLPTFAAYTAFCARGELHRPWLVGGFIERIRRNGRPAADALDLVFDQGRDLLAFFILMWEIVFKERA